MHYVTIVIMVFTTTKSLCSMFACTSEKPLLLGMDYNKVYIINIIIIIIIIIIIAIIKIVCIIIIINKSLETPSIPRVFSFPASPVHGPPFRTPGFHQNLSAAANAPCGSPSQPEVPNLFYRFR